MSICSSVQAFSYLKKANSQTDDDTENLSALLICVVFYHTISSEHDREWHSTPNIPSHFCSFESAIKLYRAHIDGYFCWGIGRCIDGYFCGGIGDVLMVTSVGV